MERYRLAELADLTGVTQRTIRFYIAEGLLPPPEGAGPAAVYTAAHRDRLALINGLKERYLPLREIRRRLAPLTEDQVGAELDRLSAEPSADTAATMPTVGTAPERPAGRLRGGRRGAPGAPDGAIPTTTTPSGPLAAAPPREQWERVTLADGVELHVRADRLREAIPLDALVRQARRLLGEG